MSTARGRPLDEEVGKKVKREADVPGGVENTAVARPLNKFTPCAACKLLRRRCAPECPFAPYFSPHEPQKFSSVHKVFGASNVSKMLMDVHEIQRADAANSLICEANIRLRDPVLGCVGVVSALQQQVQALEAELTAVRAEIIKFQYRQRSIAAAVLPSSHAPVFLASAAAPPLPSSASSSFSSMYTAVSSSTDYSSITNENISFFG